MSGRIFGTISIVCAIIRDERIVWICEQGLDLGGGGVVRRAVLGPSLRAT